MTQQYIALATSVITLIGMWGAGNHKAWAWALGLANQALWFAFIVAFGAWGLFPLNIALVIVYTRNLRKWRREQVVVLEEVHPDFSGLRWEGDLTGE